MSMLWSSWVWCPEVSTEWSWERIQEPSGGEMAEFQFLGAREPGGKGEEWEEGAGVQVKGCWNYLEGKWVHRNCTEQTQCLLQLQSLQRSIFLPFMKETWGQDHPGIALWYSLLLPSFLFSEILFLAATNAERVGKRNHKQQKVPPH